MFVRKGKNVFMKNSQAYQRKTKKFFVSEEKSLVGSTPGIIFMNIETMRNMKQSSQKNGRYLTIQIAKVVCQQQKSVL